MDEETAAHIESLETHVARLEGILHVMLEELEKGTIQDNARAIRDALPRLED
jgi:hypothetical protein